MKYYINLFSPETAIAFSKSPMNISGFRNIHKTYVENQQIGPGDKFICYCTDIQRFVGVFEVKSKYFEDNTPIFAEKDDPYGLRFEVKPIVWLPFQKSIPIHDDKIWNNLSFTKSFSNDSKNTNKWVHMIRASPRVWPKEDCEFLEKLLVEQSEKQIEYPLTETDEKKLKKTKIKIGREKEVTVTVPEDDESGEQTQPANKNDLRESTKAQAKLAEIGEKLGFKIWLPMNDRNKVFEVWKPKNDSLLEDLPLVFDEVTLKTIRNIDVLWVESRSIKRAFEVEDTTSIFSGILRMADLLSLQPMLDIKIHIVAPNYRKDSVINQINRPVFAVMEKGPLSELCSFISYDSLEELSRKRDLEHMTDSIVDTYTEFADGGI